MPNKEDFSVIKDIPAKKAQIRELKDKSEKLEKTKDSISSETYTQLAEKYRSELDRLDTELKEADRKAEEISVELSFAIEKSEEKEAAASEGLKELDTLESSGAVSQGDAKDRRRQLEQQKRLAAREAAKDRKSLDLIRMYRTAESPDEIRDSKAGGGALGSGFIDTLKGLPKKAYIAAGAGLAGIIIIIILISVLAGLGGRRLNNFLEYIPASLVEESGVDLNFLNMEKMGSSAEIRKLLGDDPLEVINDEVVDRLEYDYYFDGFDARSVKFFAVFDTSQLADNICYVTAEYDRENLIQKLKDEGFKRHTHGDTIYYSDSYEAIIFTEVGFVLCDDDDLMPLLETAADESESILQSDLKEKDFMLEHADSHLGFTMVGGYYNDFVSGGIWQTGNAFKMDLMVRYEEKEEADSIFKNFNSMMKGLKDSGMVGTFSIDKVDDTTLKIMITGITDPEIVETFF
jgi:hypothetical protein